VATPVGSVVARLIRAGYPEATARRIASGELSMDAANKMARMQEQGFTIPQYHGTYSSDVFEVDPNLVDLGLHSGTPEQATQRLRDTADPFSKTYGDFGYREEANIMPLVIRAQRPLEMRDVGDWMNSSQVLEGLIGNPRLARRRQELESLYEEAGTLQEQFEGGEEFFRDSPENREILDEIKNILNKEGYDSIRYENQVENAYGAQSALRATAEQQRRELSDQISLIENAAMERAPQPPDPDDPLVKEKMRVFLDASRRPSDYMTPEEVSRLQELKDRYREIGSDPANYNDTFSYISLNPANVRSQFAAFDPEQTGSSNILAGLGGAGVVGAGLMAPEEAEAAGFGTLARAIGQGTRRVFTGSPAEYTQPSLQKIGTGEGNQAFGYGLYFSESPGVATGYRKILSGEKLIKRLEDQELDPDLYAEDVSEMLDEGVFGEAETRFLRALEAADYLGFDHPYQAVRATFSPRMGFDMGDEAVVNLLKMRDEMGFLYETEIPADTFLDWDLPLADQPAIVQRVVDEVARRQPERFDATMMRRYQEGKMKGKEAYYLFSQNPQEASQVWANYGVPGVRYSSQGRRSVAQKEMVPQNYVVFDDKLINMVSRNDMPLEGNFDEAAARQAMDPEMLRSRLRQMGPVGTVAASAGATASPLDRPDDVPEYMRRLDGTVKSERGFLGPIRNNVSGKTMTEVSIGQPGSEEGFYPLLVPTLTPEEVETIANMDLERERPPFSIIKKARAHALERIDRGLSPFYQDGEEGAEARSPLERPEAAERRVNARAVQVASDTLERLRRERGAVMSPLQDTRMARFGDYLTENRPSEMDPVQRALQSLGLFQGLGEYLRTTGEGQRTTTMQDINAALDVVPL